MATAAIETPWQVLGGGGSVFIVDEEGYAIAQLAAVENTTAYSGLAKNAEFIVTACNVHADLVKALKGAQQALKKALPHLPADAEAIFCGEWLEEINAALEKAGSI